MPLNHPKTIVPTPSLSPWKNRLPGNRSLVPKFGGPRTYAFLLSYYCLESAPKAALWPQRPPSVHVALQIPRQIRIG